MDLNIDYEETKSVGNNVKSQGNDFGEQLKKIKAANLALKSNWEGGDAAKYSTAVETQAGYMAELEKTINEIGAFLLKVGETYEKVAQENAKAIKTK